MDTSDGGDDFVLGELIDGDLVAEGEDDVVGVQELEDVGLRVAIGSDVPANNLHAIKEMTT